MTALAYDIVGLVASKASGGAVFELSLPHLTVSQGEKVAIVGPSGCGKSTLLDLLSLIALPKSVERFRLDPGNGPIELHQTLLAGKVDALARIRARSIGYVLQTGGLLPYLSVRHNINLGCRLLGIRNDRVEAMVERLGLAEHANKLPAALSVGERQRVAIARAIAHRPAIIIADEPTAALDPVNAATVMRLFMELTEELGATALIASHDLERLQGLGFRHIAPKITAGSSTGHTRSVFGQ